MRILVFGAAGRTGRHFVAQALAAGHAVTALTRTPSKLQMEDPALRVVQGDALDGDAVSAAMPGHDAVLITVSAGSLAATTVLSEMTRNVATAMEQHGVRRVLYVASAGALSERSQVSPALAEVLADHRRAIEVLRASSLDWTVARPPRLVDGPLTGRYRVQTEGLLAGGSSMGRADLAHFLLSELGSARFRHLLPTLAY